MSLQNNSHQSVNMAVTFQVYLAKPLWRISSSWAQLARPCRQSLLCFASHHLLQHLKSRVLWRKPSGLDIFRGVGSCAQEGTGAKVAHVTFEQTIDTHYFNQHLLISSTYVRSLKLSERGLPEFLASMSISGAGLGKFRPREEERVVEKGAASSSSSS